jgi:hypothetical protein
MRLPSSDYGKSAKSSFLPVCVAENYPRLGEREGDSGEPFCEPLRANMIHEWHRVIIHANENRIGWKSPLTDKFGAVLPRPRGQSQLAASVGGPASGDLAPRFLLFGAWSPPMKPPGTLFTFAVGARFTTIHHSIQRGL